MSRALYRAVNSSPSSSEGDNDYESSSLRHSSTSNKLLKTRHNQISFSLFPSHGSPPLSSATSGLESPIFCDLTPTSSLRDFVINGGNRVMKAMNPCMEQQRSQNESFINSQNQMRPKSSNESTALGKVLSSATSNIRTVTTADLMYDSDCELSQCSEIDSHLTQRGVLMNSSLSNDQLKEIPYRVQIPIVSRDEGNASPVENLDLRPILQVRPVREDSPIFLAGKGNIASSLVPGSASRYLRGYQIEGVRWLWNKYIEGIGCILGGIFILSLLILPFMHPSSAYLLHWALNLLFPMSLLDDMGLGKTVQICSFLLAVFHKTGGSTDIESNFVKRKNGYNYQPLASLSPVEHRFTALPCIIICPASVEANWYTFAIVFCLISIFLCLLLLSVVINTVACNPIYLLFYLFIYLFSDSFALLHDDYF